MRELVARVAGTSAGAVALATVALLLSCQPPPPARTVDPNAALVQTYPVAGGGEVRLTVRRRYSVGQPVVVPVAITAGTRAIRGPVGARVLSSGFEGEKVIRTIAPGALVDQTVAPGARASFALTWDGRTDEEAVAPKDTYTLTLDLVVGEEPARLGTTIEIADP